MKKILLTLFAVLILTGSSFATVEEDSPSIILNANGTGPYQYDFQIYENADLEVVYLNTDNEETDLVLDVDYTVTGAGDTAGGSITTTTDYGSTGRIRMTLDLAIKQAVDLRENEGLRAEVVERMSDRLTKIAQQERLSGIDRAVRASLSVDDSPDLEFTELAANRIGKTFIFDGSGDISLGAPLASSVILDEDDMATNAADQAPSQASVKAFATQTFANVAAMVASTSLNVGETVRTLGYFSPGGGGANYYSIVAAGTGTEDFGKYIDLNTHQALGFFIDGLSIKMFGAKGDGVTDDSAAIKAAIQASINIASVTLGTDVRGGAAVDCPEGTYLIGDNTFGAYTETNVKTLHFKGAGVNNTTFVLTEDGAMGHYTANSKILFPVFRDIGFYGDIYLDTAPADVTHPVSVNRKFMHSNADVGVQAFRFYNCYFSLYGAYWNIDGREKFYRKFPKMISETIKIIPSTT